jgi:hypothetical protein
MQACEVVDTATLFFIVLTFLVAFVFYKNALLFPVKAVFLKDSNFAINSTAVLAYFKNFFNLL